jgi:hypothetical protein
MMMKKLLMVFLLAISSAAFGQGSQLSQLDGEWYSDQWKYGYTLTNGVGVATSTNSPNFKVGDKILFLKESSNNSFEGTQVYKDGKFYKITVELQSNDTLLFKGEKNVSWTMTKIAQKNAQATNNTNSTNVQLANSTDSKNTQAFTSNPSTTASQNIETLRSAAKNDVVAQALNYVSGYGEDAKNSDSYYPLERNNGNCIFSRFDSWNKLTVKLDLNKGNPDTLEFESMTMNSDIRLVWYITRVEGLGEFRCLNCNSSRVQRAWALIYKECKGTRKAF